VSRLGPRRSDAWEERMRKMNVENGLSRFDDLWRPKIIAELNDYKVQLVKGQGELVWHQHDDTEELPRDRGSLDHADARGGCRAGAR